MPKPVFVVATFKAKPGQEAAAEAAIQSMLVPTHEEEGCVIYTAHKRVDQPGHYYVIEKWRSQVDLDQHLNAPHITAAMVKKDELFSVIDIGMIEPIPGGDPFKGKLFK